MKAKNLADQEDYFTFLIKDTFTVIIAASLGKKLNGYN
jgi:hypothetical protein